MSARQRLIEFMVNNTPLPEEEVVPFVDEVEAEAYSSGFDDGKGFDPDEYEKSLDFPEEDGQ